MFKREHLGTLPVVGSHSKILDMGPFALPLENSESTLTPLDLFKLVHLGILANERLAFNLRVFLWHIFFLGMQTKAFENEATLTY